jgi:hypothetical protein
MRFYGTYTALITPLRDGAIDVYVFQAFIERQIASGVDGIVPVGTTNTDFTALRSGPMALSAPSRKKQIPADTLNASALERQTRNAATKSSIIRACADIFMANTAAIPLISDHEYGPKRHTQ